MTRTRLFLRGLAVPLLLLLAGMTNGVQAQYCAPPTTTLHTFINDYMTNVAIAGTTLNSSNGTNTTTGYTLVPPTPATNTATLIQGLSYTLTMTYGGSAGAAFEEAIWIDFNADGTFNTTTEYIPMVPANGVGTSSSVTFTVPGTATLGATGMRVRTRGGTVTSDPCLSYASGETEDYTITIAAGTPCSGAPVAGTAVASVAAICPNLPFNVTATGGTSGVTGLTYQLQTSSTGAVGSYNPVGTAQASPVFNITGITATTYYRIMVFCGTASTPTVADTVTVNAITACYCNANLGGFCGAGNGPIDNFTLNTLSNLNSGCSATGPNGAAYVVYPPTGTNTTSLVIGSTYSVTIGTTDAAITSVWIDYNQDGQWTASEHTQVSLNSTNATANITIPVGALPGQTGMRVRSRLQGNQNGPGDACLNMGSGETEDYTVTLVAPVPCSGAPLAGTANASNTTPCPGTQVIINLTGGTIASNITYQLESSTTSATAGFGAVGTSNATGIFTVTPPGGNTWYRIVTTCNNTPGGSATSVAVQVTGQGAITTLPWNEGIEGVTTTGPTNFPQCWKKVNGDWQSADANFTSYHDPRTGTRYLTNQWLNPDEWIMTPGFALTGGTSYDFSFYWAGDGFSGWDGYVGVNNIQDSTGATILGAPFVVNTTTTGTAYQQVIRTFTPTTTGTYFFGVRVSGNGVPWYLGFDDFRVNLTPTCPQPNVLPVTAITATGATLNWSPATTPPALGYQYEVRTSGAPGSGATGLVLGPTIVPGTTTTQPVTGLTGTTNYTVYVRAICSAGDSSFWASATFLTSLDCATATAISPCGASQTFSLTGAGAYNPVQTPSGPNIYGTPGMEKLYTFTATVTGTYTLDVSATNSAYVDYFFKPVTAGCSNTGWTFIDDIFGPTTPGAAPTLALTAGTQYYILADPEQTTTTSHTFTINCPPTCGMPTNVNVTTTTTGASVSWTQNPPGTPTTWQISVVTPQGGPASSGVMSIATTNPAPISGLTPSTPYSFYVRAICGPGDTSLWSAVFDVSTQCLPASLPFTENFSNLNFNFPPTCWELAQGQLGTTLVGGYSNWFEDDYLNANGTGIGSAKVNIYGTTTPQREWLISPSIDLGATPGNFQVEFDLGIVQWIQTTPTALGSDDTLALVISTDNGATWSLSNALQIWTAANTPINTTTGGQRFYIPMNGYSGTIKLGWYGTNGVVSDVADNDIFVDSVRVISTCTPPSVTLGTDTTVCGNVSVLQLNAGQGPAGTTYAWSNSFNATMGSTQTFNAAPVLNALNASPNNLVNVVTFYSTVTVGANCSKSDTINVAVTYTPRVSSISATLTGAVPNQYAFAPMGDSFATSYVWIFGDGGVAATANATHTYTTPGTYTPCLIVSNPCGNDTTCATPITVIAGVADALADGSSVSIFPNPTAADAVLEVTGGATLRSYQVMSATGALVQERSIKGKGVTKTTLNTDVLAPGIYTLRIQLDKGVVVRKLEVLK